MNKALTDGQRKKGVTKVKKIKQATSLVIAMVFCLSVSIANAKGGSKWCTHAKRHTYGGGRGGGGWYYTFSGCGSKRTKSRCIHVTSGGARWANYCH
jgi:hypothetical protein